MLFPIETTEAEYRAIAEEDDGLDASDFDDSDDDYDPTHDSHRRARW